MVYRRLSSSHLSTQKAASFLLHHESGNCDADLTPLHKVVGEVDTESGSYFIVSFVFLVSSKMFLVNIGFGGEVWHLKYLYMV